MTYQRGHTGEASTTPDSAGQLRAIIDTSPALVWCARPDGRDFLDRDGFVLTLDGQWDETHAVLTGRDYRDPDVRRLHRVTWTPKPDGSVEELWETSTDAGRSWQVRSHGVFHRFGE